MFTKLLISTCDIQAKSSTTVGYEKVLSWVNVSTGVATRKDSATNAKISDTEIRTNTDDDIFYFEPTVTIVRGNRIVFGSEYYDVIKVNKSYDAISIHHLEVVARLIDHN